MNVKKVRDLTIVDIQEDKKLVIACDSCGGIGMKEGDTLKVPPFYTGKFTARVGLFEVITTGAQIITVADAICNEMEPTGKEILEGIKEELKELELEDIVLTGSTEENFKTTATGLGLTVIGIVDSDKLKVNSVKEEALVLAVGIPKVGGEINLQDDKEIVSYKDIKNLLEMKEVFEIVPVGSKGIRYECIELAQNNGFQFIQENNADIDLNKTAGPCTVVIAAVKKDSIEKFYKNNKITVVGNLKKL